MNDFLWTDDQRKAFKNEFIKLEDQIVSCGDVTKYEVWEDGRVKSIIHHDLDGTLHNHEGFNAIEHRDRCDNIIYNACYVKGVLHNTWGQAEFTKERSCGCAQTLEEFAISVPAPDVPKNVSRLIGECACDKWNTTRAYYFNGINMTEEAVSIIGDHGLSENWEDWLPSELELFSSKFRMVSIKLQDADCDPCKSGNKQTLCIVV